jgi:hypothetical protein
MSKPTYDDIREQITRRYTRWTWFAIHAIMAVVSVIVIWMIDPTPQDGSPIIAALWSAILFCHFVQIQIAGQRDKAIERAWERYAHLEDEDEKPKRAMRLTDDAELEEIEIIDVEPAERRISSQH